MTHCRPLVRAWPVLLLLAGCGRTESGPTLDGAGVPAIVAKSIEFHGGEVYERATISLTITSLSGTFDIVARRDGGQYEHTVRASVGPEGLERVVTVTNDSVKETRGGQPVELDAEGAQRARAFVEARVFFPLLPYTLKGGDIRFEERGAEVWDGRPLERVKVTFAPGSSNSAQDSYTFWFDPETGRVEQFGYDFAGGLRFRKAVEFERVGGVLFSDQENYAIDAERISVDLLAPEYVAEKMELLSRVELSNITVDEL